MTFYRLYLVSDVTGRFEPSKEIEAEDDRAAMARAETLRAGRPAELWSSNRMIAEWKA